MIKALFILNAKALLSGILRLNGKKIGIVKKLLITAIGVYAVACFFLIFGLVFNSILKPFYEIGLGWLYFAVLAVIVFAICLFSTIFTAQAQLFRARDNERLLAMPIRSRDILISRLLLILTAEYLFEAVISLPALALWLAGGYASPLCIVFYVLGFILLPPLAASISLLLAWFLAAVTARLRHKNIVTLLLSVVFLLAYFFAYSNLQNYLGQLLSKGTEIAAAFQKAMPPFYAFGVGIAQGNVVKFAIFVLWVILVFGFVFALLSANYPKILTTNRGSATVLYREKRAKAQGICLALVKKEIGHFWSNPNIVLNSSLGSVLMLIGAVLILIKKEAILAILSQLPFGGLSAAGLIAALLLFIASLNNLAASLISLEGKQLWIVKSIPVPGKIVLLAKIYTHLLLTSLPCLVASVAAAMVFAATFMEWLLIIILPQTLIVLLACGGLMANLLFPKLDWLNEIQVVKQGVSAMISIFGAMGLAIGLAVLYVFAFSNIMSINSYLWLTAAIFTAVSALFSLWLAKAGLRRFEEL